MPKPIQLQGCKRRRSSENHATITHFQEQELEKVQRRLPKAIAVFRKSFEGFSKVAAIKAKCIECSNFQPVEVRDCKIERCPLWMYRPYKRKGNKTDENK